MFSPAPYSATRALWASFLSFVVLLATLPTSFAAHVDDGPVVKWTTDNDLTVSPSAPKFEKGSAPLVSVVGPTEAWTLAHSGLHQIRPTHPVVLEWCMSRKMRLSISPGHSPPTV